MGSLTVKETSSLSKDEGKSTKGRISFRMVMCSIMAIDCAVIFCSSLLGQALWGFVLKSPAQDFVTALGVGALASLLFVVIAKSTGQYRLPALIRPLRQIRHTTMLLLVVGLSLTAILFLFKTGAVFSRGALIIFVMMQVIGLIAVRLVEGPILSGMLARREIRGQPIILLGTGEEMNDLDMRTLLMQFGLEEITRVVLKDDHWQNVSTLRSALEEVQQGRGNAFCVALDWGDRKRLSQVRSILRTSPLPVGLLPDRRMRSLLNMSTQGPTGRDLLITLQRAPLTPVEQAVKRVFDIVVAGAVLVSLAPLMVAIAVAIRLESPGPAIFRQRRRGFNQRSFMIFKFRSMTVLEDGVVIKQATRRDRRVTRVGWFLRRSSIDELPQLVNVLRGEMSLVGPRPHAVAHDDFYSKSIEGYYLRHHVKPGMTGWAQVKGFRGETQQVSQMRSRVEHDIWYVENWSPLLDMFILLRTSSVLLSFNAF